MKPVCEALVSLAEDNGLSQLQLKPTRENIILDLYFTNNASLVKGTILSRAYLTVT